jgi:hypothetical protein
MAKQDACTHCHHKRENHMAVLHDGRTDCDFPDCNCHGFENRKSLKVLK